MLLLSAVTCTITMSLVRVYLLLFLFFQSYYLNKIMIISIAQWFLFYYENEKQEGIKVTLKNKPYSHDICK